MTRPFRTRNVAHCIAALAVTLLPACHRGSSGPPPVKPDTPVAAATTAHPIRHETVGQLFPELPPAVDGKEALHRMVRAYRSINSLRMTTQVDMQYDFGKPRFVRQESLLKYVRKPARAMLSTKDPVAGTSLFYADGATVVHYSGVTNVYVRLTTPPIMKSIVNQMELDQPQVLTPMTISTGGDLPKGISDAKIDHEDVVNGRPVYVLTGQFDGEFVIQLVDRICGEALTPIDHSFELYVDKKNYLLLKTKVNLSWKRPRNGEKSKLTVDPIMNYKEWVTDLVQNPLLYDEEFRFYPPAGAAEKFVQKATDRKPFKDVQ